jgi:hypothetical protein
MAGQFGYTTFYVTYAYIFFFWQYLEVAYILLLLYTLFKRGGVYYIDHFPVKYENHIAQYDELGMKYDPLKIRKAK